MLIHKKFDQMVCSAIVTVISNSALSFRLFIISQVDSIARTINITCLVICEWISVKNKSWKTFEFLFSFSIFCEKENKNNNKRQYYNFFEEIWAPNEYSKERIVIYILCHSMEWWSLLLSSWYLRMMILFYQCEFVIYFCECFLLFRLYRSTGKSVTASYLPRRIQLWWNFFFSFC